MPRRLAVRSTAMLLLPAAAAALGLGLTATAAPPSGSLLWANVSEAGLGASFASAVALPAHVDVLLLSASSGATGGALQRLHPPTGKLLWSTSLSLLGLPAIRGATATVAIGVSMQPAFRNAELLATAGWARAD